MGFPDPAKRKILIKAHLDPKTLREAVSEANSLIDVSSRRVSPDIWRPFQMVSDCMMDLYAISGCTIFDSNYYDLIESAKGVMRIIEKIVSYEHESMGLPIDSHDAVKAVFNGNSSVYYKMMKSFSSWQDAKFVYKMWHSVLEESIVRAVSYILDELMENRGIGFRNMEEELIRIRRNAINLKSGGPGPYISSDVSFSETNALNAISLIVELLDKYSKDLNVLEKSILERLLEDLKNI